ncbi:MAG TPA: Ppx/GppA phosphatase family protein [Verrucomicrobiae bacterium]|nr:Ppx/GppA phosphatase family protein [Verrucomicrobiae bacterium]
MEGTENPPESAGVPRSSSPIPARRAVIDVGTNSVKLLVAEIIDCAVKPLLERSEQTRLGSGFYETHRLQPAAIVRTAQAVAEFSAEAARWQPARVRVIATSAARDALNQGELVAQIEKASGLCVDVISGEQEADWVFRGVISDPAFAGQPLLIVDVGGGSSEFILGEKEHQRFRHSLRLGTVRLLEQFKLSDPPTATEWRQCSGHLKAFIDRELATSLERELRAMKTGAVQLVGTGGTTSIMGAIQLGLARFDRDRIEGTRLTRDQVRRQRRHLWSVRMAERKEITGLPANRSDVILAGVAIYEKLMDRFGFGELRVSTRGLRFAAVMEP